MMHQEKEFHTIEDLIAIRTRKESSVPKKLEQPRKPENPTRLEKPIKQVKPKAQKQPSRSFFESWGSLFSAKSIHYKDLDQNIRDVNKHEFLRQYLPFLSILSDHKTIFTRNHSLIRVIKIAGVDGSNLSNDERTELSLIRDNFFSLLNPDVKLSFYTIRRKISDVENDEPTFKNEYAERISKTWRSQFCDSYVSETYLVVSRNYSGLSKNLEQFAVKLNAARKDFDFYITQIKTLLTKFGPADVDNSKHHQLFRLFSYLINCYEFNSKSERDLFSHLSLSDVAFNTSSGLVKIANDRVKKFSKILGVRISESGGRSEEKLLKILSTLNHEFTAIQQVRNFFKTKNLKDFKSARDALDQLPKFTSIQTRINELDEVSELVEASATNFLDYALYIKVFGNTEEELGDAAAEIQNTLAGEGIVAFSETIGVLCAFFGTLPDQEALLGSLKNSYRSRITKENVSDFVSLNAAKEGFKRSPFGESSVVDFKTIAPSVSTTSRSGNYSFTFHQDDISDRALGHTMIIGQTGTGKSTLAAFLLMNCLKFNDIKILAFDSLEGLRIPITAFGGKHITVGKDTDLKLNPMNQPDSFANRNFQKNFIEMLAGGIEESEVATVQEVISQNYTLDANHRSLKNLKLAFDLEGLNKGTQRPAIASRMKKWLGDGHDNKNEIYAKFFNNEEDNLNFSSNLVAFDMGQVIKDEELLAPTSFYIFHKFNQVIEQNPSPHVFFIDEMQKYLNSPQFNPHIISAIKESRKRNGIFIGCMQEAATLVESPNGAEIIENLATLIIFPNAKARPEHYISKLGLTDSEFEFIKTHPNPRHVLIKKKDGHSVIIDADLGILEEYLKLYSSKDTDRKLIEKLQKEANSEISWVERFLEEVRNEKE